MTWLDEIDLDPGGSSLRVGTRSLGKRPWLVVDEHERDELALKQRLSDERPHDVFDVVGDVLTTSATLVRMIEDTTARKLDVGSRHPLAAAGLGVQEDLCIMRRQADGWHLVAASLHFPSRWQLADKIGRHITALHAPVEGYAAKIAARVDSLFDAIGAAPVWRRNWFVHVDDKLFQPERPPHRVVTTDCRNQLTIRSERQTLRRVGDDIVFTIKTQRASLGSLLDDAARSDAFRRYVFAAPAAEQMRRGIHPDQLRHLRDLF